MPRTERYTTTLTAWPSVPSIQRSNTSLNFTEKPPVVAKWSPAPSKWSPRTEWSPAPLLKPLPRPERSSTASTTAKVKALSNETASSPQPMPFRSASLGSSLTNTEQKPSASFENRGKGHDRFIIDNREAASQEPHRWICSLMIYGYNETFVATGFLAKGLKTIFTTAHSLSGAEMVEIKFPGRPVISLPLFNLKKDNCIWTDSTHDFAAIRLPATSKLNFGINDGVAVTPHAQLRSGDDIWVFGYPYPIPRQETLAKMSNQQQDGHNRRTAPVHPLLSTPVEANGSLSDWMKSLPRPSEYVRPSKRGQPQGGSGGREGPRQLDTNHNSIRSPKDVLRIQRQLDLPPPMSPFIRVSEDALKIRRMLSSSANDLSALPPPSRAFPTTPSASEPLPGERIANLYESHRKTASDWPILIGGRGRVKANDGKTLRHLADTEGGDSGGPLLRRDSDGVYRVVGIHLSCRKDGAYNSAALINRAIIDRIDFIRLQQQSGGVDGREGSSAIVAFQKQPSDYLLP